MEMSFNKRHRVDDLDFRDAFIQDSFVRINSRYNNVSLLTLKVSFCLGKRHVIFFRFFRSGQYGVVLREVEPDEFAQLVGRGVGGCRKHQAENVPAEVNRSQNQPERNAPPADEKRDEEIAEFRFGGTRATRNFRDCLKLREHEKRHDTVRKVYVNRPRPAATRTVALVESRHGGFDLIIRHIHGFTDDTRRVIALLIAKSQCPVFDTAE